MVHYIPNIILRVCATQEIRMWKLENSTIVDRFRNWFPHRFSISMLVYWRLTIPKITIKIGGINMYKPFPNGWFIVVLTTWYPLFVLDINPFPQLRRGTIPSVPGPRRRPTSARNQALRGMPYEKHEENGCNRWWLIMVRIMKDYDKQMNLGDFFLHIWYHNKITLRMSL